MNINYYIGIGIFLMAAAITVFVLALYINIIEVKIAIIVAAFGLLASGLMQLGLVGEKKQEEGRYQMIMEKLEKIEKDIEGLEPSKGSGVAIADVISSGLKFYAEHMAQPKKEQKDD